MPGGRRQPDPRAQFDLRIKTVCVQRRRFKLHLPEEIHPSYTAHLPNGRLADRAQTLALVDSGTLARERHQRIQERVLIAGDTGVVIGIDRLEEPPPLAQHGERTRRYTNVYVRENGRWRLLARHFKFLP